MAATPPEPQPEPANPAGAILDRRSLQDRAVRGAGWTMIHTLTSVPLAFLVNLLLARVLGVGGYGRLAFLMTLMDVVGGIVALGVTTGTIQFGAKAHAAGRAGQVRALLSKAQGFRLLVAAPLLSVVVLLVAHVSAPMMAFAIVVGVWLPAFLDGSLTCLTIENKTAWGAKIAMIANLVTQAGVVIALLTAGTADVVWAVRLALTAVGVGLALLVIDPAYRAAVLRPRVPRQMPAGFWRFALPTALAALLGTLVVSRTEVFFLDWLGDPAAVGFFALAFGLASHIFAPAQALVGPLIPAVSGLREVDAAALPTAFLRTMRTSALLVGALTVAGVPAFALLIPPLYGAAFTRSAGMFVALSLSAGLLVAAAPVSAFVLGRLAARTVLAINLAALGVDVVVAVLTIGPLGGWGAVVANVCGALTLLILLVHSELRAMRLSWWLLLGQVRSLLLAIVVCLLVWWAAEAAPLAAVPSALVAALAGGATWILAVRSTGAGPTGPDVAVFARVVPAPARRAVTRAARLLSSEEPA